MNEIISRNLNLKPLYQDENKNYLLSYISDGYPIDEIPKFTKIVEFNSTLYTNWNFIPNILYLNQGIFFF